MDTITRNNIFLTAWEETLEQTFFQDDYLVRIVGQGNDFYTEYYLPTH